MIEYKLFTRIIHLFINITHKPIRGDFYHHSVNPRSPSFIPKNIIKGSGGGGMNNVIPTIDTLYIGILGWKTEVIIDDVKLDTHKPKVYYHYTPDEDDENVTYGIHLSVFHDHFKKKILDEV